MAIISDGVTDVTIDYVDENINPVVERTTKRTAGGNLRTITSGERLDMQLNMRVTPAQYRSLLTIFTNKADNYFYTPEASTASYWSALYPSLTFPMNATFRNMKRDWDNRGYWYVQMNMESTEYL